MPVCLIPFDREMLSLIQQCKGMTNKAKTIQSFQYVFHKEVCSHFWGFVYSNEQREGFNSYFISGDSNV